MSGPYQIYATEPDKQIVASYTEAETIEQAIDRCLVQFPEDEGYYDHYVENLDTGEKLIW